MIRELSVFLLIFAIVLIIMVGIANLFAYYSCHSLGGNTGIETRYVFLDRCYTSVTIGKFK